MTPSSKGILVGFITFLIIGLWPIPLLIFTYLTAPETKNIGMLLYPLIGTIPSGTIVGILLGFAVFLGQKKQEREKKKRHK